MTNFLEEALPIGTEYVGDVDQVPGLLRVATKCQHAFGAPLVPRGTFLVVDSEQKTVWFEPVGEARAISLPFSWRSYMHAWERWMLVATGTVCLALGLAAVLRDSLVDRRWLATGAAVVWAVIAEGLPAGWKVARNLLSGVAFGIGACLLAPFEVEPWAIGFGVFSILAAAWSEHHTRASRERAIELAGRAGVSRRRVEAHLDELGVG